jgi:hypothetical protein
VTALAIAAGLVLSVAIIAFVARDVAIRWLAEGAALEQVAQLRAEMAATDSSLRTLITAAGGEAEVARRAAERANDELEGVRAIALAAQNRAQLGGRR